MNSSPLYLCTSIAMFSMGHYVGGVIALILSIFAAL